MQTNRKSPKHERETLYSTEADRLSQEAGARAIRTSDHEAVRRWAARHDAEPATGEASTSGPATIQVNDGGTGLRFNFPGLARFRSITWEEWFDHFDREDLIFVYEEEVVDRAYSLWQARGAESGRDLDDWLEAERQLGAGTVKPIGRYRIVKNE
jgi:hypothetical protein